MSVWTPVLAVAYLVVGFLLSRLAIRQGHHRDLTTALLWTLLWPAGFILARLVDPPADMSRPYRFRDFAAYLAAVSAPALASYPIAWALGMPVGRPFYTCLGISMLVYGARRPHWFWNLASMQHFRILLGDRLTQAFYIVLGIALIWIGLLTDIDFPPRSSAA